MPAITPTDQDQDQQQPDQPQQPDVQPDQQPPTMQEALAGSPAQPSMPDLGPAPTPDRPAYKPGFVNRIIGSLEGLAQGGVPGAIVGAVNPRIPAKVISNSQQETANEQQLAASKVKFANTQAAQAAVQLAMDQHTLARLPMQERIAAENADSAREASYLKAGLQPIAGGPVQDSDKIMQGAYDKYSADGQPGVPVLSLVHSSGGQVHVFDLTQLGSTNQQNYQALKDYENISGVPAPSRQDFNAMKPAQRLALVDGSARYKAPIASTNPAVNQNLIARYEGDLAGYQQRNPDAEADDTTVQWFNKTIANLKSQGASHFNDANQLKQQAQQNAKAAAAKNAPAKIDNMVVGSMADGSQVAGTAQELQAAGASGITKLPSDEAKKVVVARQMVAPNGLFASVNNDLRTLDAQGKLGVVASRWSDFMAGKVGSDPEFAKLRTDMGLLGSALMQAHVGARGSKDMLEHFAQLADYRISDAPTLRAALGREYSYVTEKAMRAKPAAKAAQPPAQAQPQTQPQSQPNQAVK